MKAFTLIHNQNISQYYIKKKKGQTGALQISQEYSTIFFIGPWLQGRNRNKYNNKNEPNY